MESPVSVEHSVGYCEDQRSSGHTYDQKTILPVDINDYIASGVLELYVAGALPEIEVGEVEQMIAMHPAIRFEVDAIHDAFEVLALANAARPRPELRRMVLNTVASIGHQYSMPAADTPANAGVVVTAAAFGTAGQASAANRTAAVSAPTIVSLPPRIRYLLAASFVIAVLTSATSVYVGFRWNAAEDSLAELRSLNELMVAEKQSLKARFTKSESDVAALRTATSRISLKAVADAHNVAAVVFWDTTSGHVHLDGRLLPALPLGKQYQLWAIVAGKPVDAGLVSSEIVDGLVAMKDVGSAQAFAITVEPIGGSAAPTIDAMIVHGNV